MPTPEIFIASDEHTERLAALRATGAVALGDYMDDVVRDVLSFSAQGAETKDGNCDEATFLRAFFAGYQSAKHGYAGGVPPLLQSSVAFSRWVQNQSRASVAEIEYDEYLELSRIVPKPSGVIINTGNDVSPVIDYKIHAGGTITGEASFAVLYTPEDPQQRRKEDISEEDITDHVIIELERAWGDTEVVINSAFSSDADMGIIVTTTQIDRVDMQYNAKARTVRGQDRQALIAAARAKNLIRK